MNTNNSDEKKNSTMQPVTKLCELDNVASEESVTKTVFAKDDSLPDFETKMTEKSITEKSVEIQDEDWLFLYTGTSNLQPGWSNFFSRQINHLFPECVPIFKRHRSFSIKRAKETGIIFKANASCKHKGKEK